MSVPRFWRELDTRYNLIGSYCKITKTYHYPRRSFNPEAGRESIGSMEDYQFKGTGTVVTATVVHQAQTGYEMFGPYCMAIIELDEGPRITSQIVDCRPDTVKSGMRVKSVSGKSVPQSIVTSDTGYSQDASSILASALKLVAVASVQPIIRQESSSSVADGS